MTCHCETHALSLLVIQAYKARHISMEFSESKYLAIAVGSWFEVVLVGIPLLALVNRCVHGDDIFDFDSSYSHPFNSSQFL